MAASSFAQLPTELQTLIITSLLRPTDVSNVCLVSKDFCAVAVPLLYHSITINVDRWNLDVLKRFLQYGHLGHMYVRSLDIDSDELSTEDLALKTAKDALQVLPRDCLRSFRCPLENGIDNDLMILLSTQQRRLSFIALGPLLDNALNIPDSARPWPPKIETIVIPWKIRGAVDIKFYRRLIDRSRSALKAITIRTENYGSFWKTSKLVEFPDSAHLARGLLCKNRSAKNHQLLRLVDLNFQNQDFEKCGSIWLDHVDFWKLSTLQIWNCDNTDRLLNGFFFL